MIISVILMLFLVSTVCDAASTSHVTWGSDGKNHAHSAKAVGQNIKAPSMGKIKASTASPAPVVAGAVSFTSIPAAGNCVDNTKKIAVYIPTVANPVYSETYGKLISTAITYAPFCTAMFYEYNPDYLSDSTITTKLTKANYDLLIVPMSEMSNTAATYINKYLANGGSVWFLNDPSMLPNGLENDHRITILGSARYSGYNTISGSSVISINNSDDITSGHPDQFSPVGKTEK
jgi:hypothetical protein